VRVIANAVPDYNQYDETLSEKQKNGKPSDLAWFPMAIAPAIGC
jgi:hypothetical protein